MEQQYLPPTTDRAVIAGKNSRFLKGKGTLWSTHSDAFIQLGPGVALYFDFVKRLAVLFAVLFVLTVPHLLISYYGKALPEKAIDPVQLVTLSAGNHADRCNLAGPFLACLFV